MRILVVEDEPRIAADIRLGLERANYAVDVTRDGENAWFKAETEDYDAIVLDLGLPKLDGLSVLKRLRHAGVATPVLILTARGEESDKVRGLKLGADDYVTKPFGVLELLARVEALLRRSSPRNGNGAGHEVFRFGDVEVRTATRTVLRDGREAPLTPKEYDLLVALLRRGGAVASRVELMTEVWGYSAAVLSRTVDTHIAELRRKLEPGGAERHILTVRKIGYRLETAG